MNASSRRPVVGEEPSRADSDARVPSAIECAKNSDLTRWARPEEPSGSANVHFRWWYGRLAGTSTVEAPPNDKLAQELPRRPFLKGGGAEQGCPDRCAGLG